MLTTWQCSDDACVRVRACLQEGSVQRAVVHVVQLVVQTGDCQLLKGKPRGQRPGELGTVPQVDQTPEGAPEGRGCAARKRERLELDGLQRLPVEPGEGVTASVLPGADALD